MLTDYRLQPSTRRCTATGRELRPGDRYYGVLFDEAGAFVRKDYSAEAWEGPPEGAFSFWMSRVAGQETRKKLVVDDELLLDCFTRLEGQEDPGRLRFRFVVALLLARRRRLILEGMDTEDGREVLRLRCSRSGAGHRVENPGLSEEEIVSVQEEVFQLLGWE